MNLLFNHVARMRSSLIIATITLFFSAPATASAVYWSLFNIEEESIVSAQYATYDTASDMLNDTNRLGVFNPNSASAGRNIVGSGSDGSTYWSLFNIEEESSISAQYATYSLLSDMLNDTNRLGVFNPNSASAGRNIVGSGSDGSTYWSLFNIEEESSISAQYATYDTLSDMLNDTNRLGVFNPNSASAGRNIVGSGSDGSTYWSLFNIEEESIVSAQYATYSLLSDMLNDTNRLGVFNPNSASAGRNIVGSGASIPEISIPPVPVPAAAWLFGSALIGLVGFGKRRKKAWK